MNWSQWFRDYDDYVFYSNPGNFANGNGMLTLDEYHELMAQIEESQACHEIDSDYAYEKHMNDLAVEQAMYKGEVSWTR